MRRFSLYINGKAYQVEVGDLANAHVPVKVNGQEFLVEVEKEALSPRVGRVERRVAPALEPAREVKTTASTKGTEDAHQVLAPMPGKVLAVRVKEGDQVEHGDELLVFEAMKMEQILRAHRGGVIKAVRVAAGQNILRGDVLIELA